MTDILSGDINHANRTVLAEATSGESPAAESRRSAISGQGHQQDVQTPHRLTLLTDTLLIAGDGVGVEWEV
ncbi:hypothetical protein Q7C36_023506 [Tachysurus vachellii]|uniref:Uncharacterized protein n=1 Tax=Tachysurus vachellii TaxID=175792 RepID=A0AA88IIV1_TACVA|nr:hypothetical protein Q7C36_023506 [Tachysurus vachellii]